MPWCIKKCPYCDFNSHPLLAPIPEQHYIHALLNDLQQDLKLLNTPPIISSIFIGGGTPSLFSAKALDCLLTGIAQLTALQDNIEITLEANPSTVESHKFAEYHAIGINRLSIGVQSFNDCYLQRLGRTHNAKEAINAIEIAHQAGFAYINIDLMFGLPEQNRQAMLKDMQTAITMQTSHISYYQLTLEPNTYFYKFPPRLPQDDTVFLGQQDSQQLLFESGYQHYEISAYAKKNAVCQHNLNYWQFGDYLGIGAGAHGKISLTKPSKILRTSRQKNPEHYLKNQVATITPIATPQLPLEFLMNQLRLKAGFNLSHYQATTGLDAITLESALQTYKEDGLLVQQGQQFFCSTRGWHFLDDILTDFATLN